jgi:ATP-dependent Clp protease ATP-binding subunit ClpA
MLEKFTSRSKHVIVLAQDEARALNHSRIEPEHVLLGLLSEGIGVGAVALESLGITRSAVRSKAMQKAGELQQTAPDNLPFSAETKRALERSVEEAHGLGDGYVGTESILLALAAEPNGSAAQILVQLGADLDRVRSRVTELLGGTDAPSGPPDRDPPATETGGSLFEKFTDRARRVVVMSLEEARGLNHTYIGTEHILLGLIREGEGVAAHVLIGLGADIDRVRQQVVGLLAGYRAGPLPRPPA